ncbi:LysR family transcriptional regulator [Roseiarcaceae bacterium H3SJ34-1]|uniref:LysR family transcriptional regulator n=1 Tax=Terripilifer ovatus TaxID=3032367 RepID=UPI003AB99F04|nr:LysR family transcriptional regulator [Roseiarcaceae bacterium H3SJ34-1]
MGRFSLSALVRRVDLLTLKLFLAVAEEGQLARAASREHIVPSAVTKRIQELEETIGERLFDRGPKGTVLTPIGQVVARYVREMFSGIERMRMEIDDTADMARGRVRICATESIIVEFLADDIHRFAQDNPSVCVELLPQQAIDLTEDIEMGQMDIGLFAAYGSGGAPCIKGASVREYRCDQLVAVVPRGHALTGLEQCSLMDLVDAGLIGLRPTSPLMVHLRKTAEAEGFTLHFVSEVTTNESARALVKAGLGVSIQPRGVLDLEDYERISLIPLTHAWACRRLYLAVQSRQPLNDAVRALVAQLAEAGAVAAL